ncbi:MAG: PqqD family protein [Firmicutes bacterium]|nr:PqqD family protein [Bacillota bacterium]
MKLKQGMVTSKVGRQHVLIPTGEVHFHGVVRSNPTAAFIIEQLKSDTSEEKIVDAMLAEYDAPREQIAQDVHKVIEQLREQGFLDE